MPQTIISQEFTTLTFVCEKMLVKDKAKVYFLMLPVTYCEQDLPFCTL